MCWSIQPDLTARIAWVDRTTNARAIEHASKTAVARVWRSAASEVTDAREPIDANNAQSGQIDPIGNPAAPAKPDPIGKIDNALVLVNKWLNDGMLHRVINDV